jgi:transposase
MMRPSNDIEYVWLAREPQDFRKGINGLSIVVEEQLAANPFSGHLFVFINKGRDKIKALYWERSGFCLWQKRLEKERFKWPEHLSGAPPPANPARGACGTAGASDTSTIVLDGQQLNWLLDGYDLAAMRPHRSLCYRTVL